jgi:WD40 repeat protein/predicted Ser/Thr protein kinase
MNNTNGSSKTILQSSENEETILYDRTIALDAGKLKVAEENIPTDWNIGDIILDLYEVTDILGKGGMGKVYKVYHKNWKMDLAVKSPLPEIVATETGKENFVREAETWVNLGLHPHIVSCYYVRTLGNIPRVFAEYIEGGSLKDWISNGKLYEGGKEKTMERILDIAIQFAWGLDYAHEQGLIHQDIKPANVLMTNDGIAKVTDFGLAKARAMTGEKFIPDSGRSILVSTGGMTPAYCSPEQAAGELLSSKTDIWSWGVSILEMFTGEVDWMSGVVALAALESYLNEGSENPDIPRMPDSLAELLRKCFQQDTQNRPADISEVVDRLKFIYKEVTSRGYSRKEPKSLDLRADGLNNKAISMLDLGKEEEAVKSWQEALKVDPQHLYSNFNYGYYRWQKAEITDDSLITQMAGMEKVYLNNPDYWLCLGWIHYERGDVDSIDRIQKSEHRIEEVGFNNAQGDSDKPFGRNVQTFKGHTYYVSSVGFSPDGDYALSGGGDETIRLWNISNGKEIRKFKGSTEIVDSVCFSPDGQFALSGGGDKIIRLWKIPGGKEVRRFEGHSDCINSVCFSPDGRYVLSGSLDETIRLWDISSGKEIMILEGHTDCVNSVCFSPDSRFVLSGAGGGFSTDNTIRLWEISTGREIRKFEGHTGTVRSICISINGRYALSGSLDKTIRLWDITSGKEIRRFEGHNCNVNCISISTDGCYLLSGNEDNTIRLWEISSGKEIRCFNGHSAPVNSVCFSQDGRYALSGGDDETLKLWEISFKKKSRHPNLPYPLLSKIKNTLELTNEKETINKILDLVKYYINEKEYKKAYLLIKEIQHIPGYEREQEVLDLKYLCCGKGKCKIKSLNNSWCVTTIIAHTESANSVSFSPDGRFALSGSFDKTIRLWEIPGGKAIKSFEEHSDCVYSVCFSPDGRYALSGSNDNTIRLWEISSGKEIRKFEGHTNRVSSVSFSPDGQYILSCSFDKTIRLWEISTGREIRRLEGHTDSVNSVCFSPDGRYVLSGGYDCSIRLWEVSSGKEIKRFVGRTGTVISICFSPDGLYALSGSMDNTVRLWEISTGREVRIFEGHSHWINSISITFDGRYILSGSWDKTIRLWDTVSGEEIKRFEDHIGRVESVQFSNNGRYALSGSEDKTIKLWEFDWEWEFPNEEENQSYTEGEDKRDKSWLKRFSKKK